MVEYEFSSAGAGEVAKVCNKWALAGWKVDKLFRDNNRFYMLLVREAVPRPSVAARKPGRPRKEEMTEESE